VRVLRRLLHLAGFFLNLVEFIFHSRLLCSVVGNELLELADVLFVEIDLSVHVLQVCLHAFDFAVAAALFYINLPLLFFDGSLHLLALALVDRAHRIVLLLDFLNRLLLLAVLITELTLDVLSVRDVGLSSLVLDRSFALLGNKCSSPHLQIRRHKTFKLFPLDALLQLVLSQEGNVV